MSHLVIGSCPTGKQRYRNRLDARIALASTRGAHDSGKPYRAERRAYRCPECHGWHLTSRGRAS